MNGRTKIDAEQQAMSPNSKDQNRRFSIKMRISAQLYFRRRSLPFVVPVVLLGIYMSHLFFVY
jgi:hypothetical protein